MKSIEEKWIKLEEEFALQYHTEHKHTPTYAEAIEWSTKQMIGKAKEAYCKASRCGVPRDTCLRLGTCDKYDNFVKLLEE